MLPFCYESGLTNGHNADAAQFVSLATETFIKEVMTSIFSKTRSNGPGDSGSAGLGVSSSWIQTHRYRRQLAREEHAAQRGEVTRDKSGLLPVEARAAGERGPLGMTDLRIALEMADNGLAHFPMITTAASYGYREGELENWHDYTWHPGQEPEDALSKADKGGKDAVRDIRPQGAELPNGHGPGDAMDIDLDEMLWEGADFQDGPALDSVLDSCLAVGS